jgi:hypothetical protein
MGFMGWFSAPKFRRPTSRVPFFFTNRVRSGPSLPVRNGDFLFQMPAFESINMSESNGCDVREENSQEAIGKGQEASKRQHARD